MLINMHPGDPEDQQMWLETSHAVMVRPRKWKRSMNDISKQVWALVIECSNGMSYTFEYVSEETARMVQDQVTASLDGVYTLKPGPVKESGG